MSEVDDVMNEATMIVKGHELGEFIRNPANLESINTRIKHYGRKLKRGHGKALTCSLKQS